MKPKTIALYLPQFHRVPENDEWWAEGYTEWVAVKAAEKLYEGHNQPRVPLNKNYYNLLEHDTMAWQAEIMKKYHVHGMCMYHYWFENGRKVLEKPVENLLKWTDISMPFCFCWANETWVRTWKKLSGSNTWTSLYESKNDSNDNGILIKQGYGREKDWEEHFQYLLPFFKDDRYIKMSGMPVFLILSPGNIIPLWSMLHYFRMRAVDNGLPGIYVIGMEDSQMLGLDAAFIKQPVYEMSNFIQKNNQYPIKHPYDEMWEGILERKIKSDKTYLCGVVDFDDTPRKGKEYGYIVEGASPEKFYGYFKKLYQKSLLLNNEFVFINAWNEWGEGMYLEPDEKNGYGYLEAVSNVVTECGEESLLREKAVIKKFYETKLEKALRKTREAVRIFRTRDKLLDDWMYLKNHKINVSHFFRKYGYQDVAIYGMGKLGRHLLYELSKEGVKVSFGIDKNSKVCRADIGIKIYGPKQKMPKTDAVVITVTDQYDKISKMLSKNMSCPVIKIEEIIQELMPEENGAYWRKKMSNLILNNFNLYERNLYKYLYGNFLTNHSKSAIYKGVTALYIKINKLLFHNILIGYIEFPITTKCSLRCKECANLIQYYDQGEFLDYKKLINDIYRLCQIVKGIEMLRILGGEPLLHPYLKEILLGILKNDNVKNIQIVTNGTMLFSEDMLAVLGDERVSVDISYYGENSKNYDNLIEQLRNNGIKFYANKNLEWTPQGDISYRNRSQKELERILKICKSDCISILDGNIHLCPRSSSGHDLKIFKADKHDYVNLREYRTKRQLKKDLFHLLNRKSIVACNYCDYYMRDKFETCIPGEQISKKEALEKYHLMICTKK